MLEREIKLRFDDPDEARAAVIAAGAHAVARPAAAGGLSARHRRTDCCAQRGSVLRVRQESGTSL